jgi:hypothetical protein
MFHESVCWLSAALLILPQMAPTASDFTEQDELNEKPAAAADAPAAEE